MYDDECPDWNAFKKKFKRIKRQLKTRLNIDGDPYQHVVYRDKHVVVSHEYPPCPPWDVFYNYTDEWAWCHGWMGPYFR